MKKKDYLPPEMKLIDMKFQASLLSCSSCDDVDGFKESDDEFGLDYNPGTDRKA